MSRISSVWVAPGSRATRKLTTTSCAGQKSASRYLSGQFPRSPFLDRETSAEGPDHLRIQNLRMRSYALTPDYNAWEKWDPAREYRPDFRSPISPFPSTNQVKPLTAYRPNNFRFARHPFPKFPWRPFGNGQKFSLTR